MWIVLLVEQLFGNISVCSELTKLLDGTGRIKWLIHHRVLSRGLLKDGLICDGMLNGDSWKRVVF